MYKINMYLSFNLEICIIIMNINYEKIYVLFIQDIKRDNYYMNNDILHD